MINTGFKRHIDVPVDEQYQRPTAAEMTHIRMSLGPRISEKWFHVIGQGYEKPWVYVAGVGRSDG